MLTDEREALVELLEARARSYEPETGTRRGAATALAPRHPRRSRGRLRPRRRW